MQQSAGRHVPWLSLRAIKSFQAGSLEITAGDDVQATATIDFASGEIAADAAKATEGAVAVFKHLFELSDDARKALNAIEVTVSERVVKAKLTVPGKTLVESLRLFENVENTPAAARVSLARTHLVMFEEAMEHYCLHVGSYPSTDQGIMALKYAPSTKRHA